MVVNNFFVAYWPFVYFPWRHSYLSRLLIFKLSCFYCWIVRIFYIFWIQFPLVGMWFTEVLSHSVCSFYLLFFLAMSCSLWDLSSLTVSQTHAPSSGNAESHPQDRQGIPSFYFLTVAKMISKVVVSFCIPFSDEHLCIFKPFIHHFSD